MQTGPRQLLLNLSDPPLRETRQQRLERILAGIPSVVLGSALTFDDAEAARAERTAREVSVGT